MFTSIYEHKIDSKNRLFMPVDYRPSLENGLYLCKSGKGYLYIMTAADWEAYQAKIDEEFSLTGDDDLLSYFYSMSSRIDTDSQGRILIPPSYMTHAGLSAEAIIVGSGKRAQIWSRERWEEHQSKIDALALERRLAEKGL